MDRQPAGQVVQDAGEACGSRPGPAEAEVPEKKRGQQVLGTGAGLGGRRRKGWGTHEGMRGMRVPQN